MKSDNGEFLFIYATGTKQKFRGVGLLIRNKRWSFYLPSEKISDRIINVCLAGNPSVTIIVAYAPSETAASNDKEEICNNILKAIECERFVSLCQQTSSRQMVGEDWHGNILAHQKHS